MEVKEPLFEIVSESIRYEIKNGDCQSVLRDTIEDGKFDLIITLSP